MYTYHMYTSYVVHEGQTDVCVMACVSFLVDSDVYRFTGFYWIIDMTGGACEAEDVGLMEHMFSLAEALYYSIHLCVFCLVVRIFV